MLDAYTVRKAVPRILIAVIGINLSIYLCVAAIDITNIIGNGLGQLITEPFLKPDSFKDVGIENNVSNGVATGGLLIGGIIGGTAIWAAGGLAVIGALIPFMITVALITLAILFTLVIRQGLLILLTVISPVAIALFVLPGTEKYFKQWLDLFIKTLIVYPIIAAIFAVSTVLGTILLGTAGASPGGVGLAKILAAIIVVFAPLVLIPFAFKLAGGAISAIMNAASGRSANVAGRAGQGFQKWKQDPNSWAGKKLASRMDDRRKRGLTAGQVAAGFAGGVKNRKALGGFRKAYTSSSGAIYTDKSLQRVDEIGKHEAVRAIANNDDFLEAGRLNSDPSEMFKYLRDQGYSENDARQGVASILRAKAVASEEEFKRFAAVQNASTGTGYSGGVHQMFDAINDAAGGDRVLAGNMLAVARSKAAEARRFDLGGAGFGTTITAMNDYNDGKITAEEADRRVTSGALEVNGPGAMIGGRGRSVELLLPAMQQRLENSSSELQSALDSGDEQRIRIAKRTHKQNLASTAGLLDVAAQVSPENAKILAGYQGVRKDANGKKVKDAAGNDIPEYKPGLMDVQTIDENGSAKPVSQAFEDLRGDPEFTQMRREYSSGATAELARRGDPGARPENPIPPNIQT